MVRKNAKVFFVGFLLVVGQAVHGVEGAGVGFPRSAERANVEEGMTRPLRGGSVLSVLINQAVVGGDYVFMDQLRQISSRTRDEVDMAAGGSSLLNLLEHKNLDQLKLLSNTLGLHKLMRKNKRFCDHVLALFRTGVQQHSLLFCQWLLADIIEPMIEEGSVPFQKAYFTFDNLKFFCKSPGLVDAPGLGIIMRRRRQNRDPGFVLQRWSRPFSAFLEMYAYQRDASFIQTTIIRELLIDVEAGGSEGDDFDDEAIMEHENWRNRVVPHVTSASMQEAYIRRIRQQGERPAADVFALIVRQQSGSGLRAGERSAAELFTLEAVDLLRQTIDRENRERRVAARHLFQLLYTLRGRDLRIANVLSLLRVSEMSWIRGETGAASGTVNGADVGTAAPVIYLERDDEAIRRRDAHVVRMGVRALQDHLNPPNCCVGCLRRLVDCCCLRGCQIS